MASVREKWMAFLAGQDVGPMVSPLCDDWSLDMPYHWPYQDVESFPPGHPQHGLGQQMAMAGVCGWDPTFLCDLPFGPRTPAVDRHSKTTPIAGGVRVETVIHTPYGDLTGISEKQQTTQTIKAMLAEREDYIRMTWLVRQQMDYDEDAAIRIGREQRAGVGQRGVMGTWWGPPIFGSLNREEMFYHLADWPDAVEELHQAQRQSTLKRMRTYAKAGYDYLFYCVDGTEWISPNFFRDYVTADSREMFDEWRKLGGFVLWHSCGRVANLIELGVYNELLPEIFETLSEPPIGNVPSLRWAREKLDPRIATKGNIPLSLMLQGTPEDVRKEVRRVREATRGYRHIVGLGDDMLHNTPLANAKAFVEESRV